MHSRTSLLLTGFEPFGRFDVNPSWQAARVVAQEMGSSIAARRLPVDFHRARNELVTILDELRPQACLSMGLAAGDVFRLERVARKVPQFSGLEGFDQASGNWSWDSIHNTLSRLNVPWRYSDDCGMYVCESTYWSLLQYASEHGFPQRCGFLHVPAVSEMFPVQRTIQIVREIARSFVNSHQIDNENVPLTPS